MIAVAGADVLRVALAENSPVKYGGNDVYFTSFLGENRVTKVPIYIYIHLQKLVIVVVLE